MFKNSLQFPVLTNEFKELFSCVSPDFFIESMSSDKSAFIGEEDITNFLTDLEEIITTPPTSQNVTEEDREKIRQWEEVLINSDPTSPHQSSNDSFGQSDELLLNPRDHNLIDVDLDQTIACSSITANPSPESASNLGPVSPVTDINQRIDSLNINTIPYISSPVMSPSFVSPPNVEPTTYLLADASVISSQRIRTFSEGTSVMDPYFDTSFRTTSQPMTIRPSNRGGHSARPYGGSLTDPLPMPLPEFDSVFRQNTGLQTTQNIGRQSMSSFSGSNPMSPPLSQPLPYSQMERSTSEPIFQRVNEYPSRIATTHRGRPVSRHQPRRQPTAAQRREQLENELTAQEITHYELDSRYRNLYDVAQYFRRRLRESGFTESQLNEILEQNRYNREGPN